MNESFNKWEYAAGLIGDDVSQSRHEGWTILRPRTRKPSRNYEHGFKDAIELIKTLREDAELALDGGWDKSDDGFRDQISLIDKVMAKHGVDF